MSATTFPPTFSHAPVVFFRGQYVFRTPNGTLAVILPLVVSAIGLAIAVYIAKADEELLSDIVSLIFASVASVFGGLGLWALWSCVRNRRVRVEINENGIICGKRFWSWDRVGSFSGERFVNGVCLGFIPRTIIWGFGDLPTTPLLTEEQYIKLAKEVSQGISERFPHVVVDMHPRWNQI